MGRHRRHLYCYSRMPSPLLALMERPGSARFMVMEGMLTEPLKPARFSCTRTFWFKRTTQAVYSEGEGTNVTSSNNRTQMDCNVECCPGENKTVYSLGSELLLFCFHVSHKETLCPLLSLIPDVRTMGRSLRIWIPSPGPMWATWLKLVGLEISLFLISGSRSISL